MSRLLLYLTLTVTITPRHISQRVTTQVPGEQIPPLPCHFRHPSRAEVSEPGAQGWRVRLTTKRQSRGPCMETYTFSVYLLLCIFINSCVLFSRDVAVHEIYILHCKCQRILVCLNSIHTHLHSDAYVRVHLHTSAVPVSHIHTSQGVGRMPLRKSKVAKDFQIDRTTNYYIITNK